MSATTSTHKPLCPCCQQAYASSILSGDAAPPSKDSPPAVARFLLCHSCAPSDVEKALAAKATSDPTIPPIVWPLTPADIKTKTDEILAATKANLDEIGSVPLTEVTFSNTVAKLMVPPNYKTNPNVCAVKFLQHCSTDADVREVASKAGKALAASRVEGRMRRDVYQRVKAFSETEECAALGEYEAHFVKAALNDFERAGLALSDDDSERLKALMEKDAAICSEFGTNLGSDTTKIFFTPAELEGCGEDFIKERLGKDEEGKCTVTLKYPDIIPIGTNCIVAETRRKVAEAREGVGAYKNNLDLVAKGINVRKEIATLLGFDSWAEYICSQRMSGSYKAVDDFLSSLQSKLRDAGKDNLETLLAVKKTHCAEMGVVFDGKLSAWDSGFYNNLLLKRDYGVDAEKIREYFPLMHVVDTTLAIYQELLGLTFTELHAGTYWSWHKEVRCFNVKDTATGNRIGHFYLDLFPREGKYGHAAIFHLVKHNADHAAVDCMLCNLPPPAADGKPSLLRHTNVVTFL